MGKETEKSGLSQKSNPFDQRGNRFSARLPSDYSPPNLGIRGVKENVNFSDLSDYQLTVRPKVDLTRYQVSMLLEVVNFEAVEFGVDFTTWLTMEWLFTRLSGSKRVWEIRDINERRVLLSAELILLTTFGKWMNLGEREQLPQEIREYLVGNKLISSPRTICSRKDYWNPEKFLEVRAVRMDVFLERETNTIRYSSYCKGYGESSSMGRRQKTRSSTELDGEAEERPDLVIPLLEIPRLLYLNLKSFKKIIKP